MNTYIIQESTKNAQREGFTIQAKDLSQAKRQASRKQCFHGTLLYIYSESKRLLSVKENNRWTDI